MTQSSAARLPSADPPDLATDLVKKLTRSLRSNDVGGVKALFAKLAASPLALESRIAQLQYIFLRVNQGGLFLDLLLGDRRQTLSRLRLIAQAIEAGRAVGRETEVWAALSEIKGDPSFPAIRWGQIDQLSRFKRSGVDLFREIRALKYAGVSLVREELFSNAEALSGRLDLPQRMLDRLYNASRHSSMPRADWERQVKSAFCADHITKDFTKLDDNLARWLGGPATDPVGTIKRRIDDALRDIDRSKGILLVTFHGGFARLTLGLYCQLFEKGLIVLGGTGIRRSKDKDKSVDERYIVAPGNERSALFRAVRTIQDGGMVWLGPDAPFGNHTSSIEMLGVSVPIAEGAPFIAHQTNCNTVWLSFVREGAGLAPVVAIGPRRGEKEKYGEFKARWLEFFRERVEDFLTGDPRNLALRTHWTEYLSALPDRPAPSLVRSALTSTAAA